MHYCTLSCFYLNCEEYQITIRPITTIIIAEFIIIINITTVNLFNFSIIIKETPYC